MVCRRAAALCCCAQLPEWKLGVKANADVKEQEAAITREASERFAKLGVEAILVDDGRAMVLTAVVADSSYLGLAGDN